MRFLYFIVLFGFISLNADTKIESYYFVDKNKIINKKNLYENKDRFLELELSNTSFGLQNNTVWIYLKVTNTEDKLIDNAIEFPYAIMDYLHYFEYENGIMVKENLTGDMVAFDSRMEKVNTFVFKYHLSARETKEIFFKADTEGALNLKMNFYNDSSYSAESKTKFLLLGFYFGAVIIMLVYNTILYFMIKEKVYFYYVLFHFEYLFLQLGLNGLAFQYFWPQTPIINVYYIPVMLALANYFSIIFTISFLNVRNNFNRWYRYFKWLKYVFISIVILTFLISYNYVVKVIALFSILSVSSLFIFGLYVLIKYKTIESKFYVTAWSFLLLGVLLTELQNVGLLPISFLTLYGTQIGAFFELALLSIALAHRYNTIIVKLKKTESELKILNEELELKVEDRTKNLDKKNRQLSIEIGNKNVLMRELFHRVKNNLQIISGLLSLQSKRIKDENMKNIFKDTTMRIKSMAMIHERLYSSDNLEAVNMQEYIKNLVEDIKNTLHGRDIKFSVACENINLGIEKAVPMGIIINELTTNGLKYAFDSKSDYNNIDIKMYMNSQDELVLEFKDNGIGVDFENLKEGFGFKLIETLAVYQLKGKLHYFNNDGLNYIMRFKKY